MKSIDMAETRLAKDMTPGERRRYVENHTGGYRKFDRKLDSDALFGEHVCKCNVLTKRRKE